VHKATRGLVRKARVVANRGVERKAVNLARNIASSQIVIDEEKGYASFKCEEIGLSLDVTKLSSLAADWKVDPQRSTSNKPFLRNILRSKDLLEWPELMSIALNSHLFGAATHYLGQVPWLVNLQVWWTPPNQTAVRSQLFHYDHRDTRQMKVFINLNDVGLESGPLHFLPANSSLKVDRKIGYSQDDYTDAQVESACSKEEIVRALGPQGSGFMVDTARCLHYGSRGNRQDRLVLMVSFARVNCVDKGAGCEVLDPVREQIGIDLYSKDEPRAFALLAR
jgi:hypothetical protein